MAIEHMRETTAAAPQRRKGVEEPLLAELSRLPRGARRDRVVARLVAENMPLAMRLARRYMGRGESYEDLRQVAALGLLQALERYDPQRGNSFGAFAEPTILGELRRYFRDCAWSVHVPRAVKDLRQDLVRARDELAQRHGHTPVLGELADHVGASAERTRQALVADAAYQADSLDRAVAPEGCDRHALTGGPDSRLEEVPDRVAVRRLIRRLPEREQRILVLRFFHGMTQSQIGTAVGLSQMHVSRLLTGALSTLRDALLSDPVDSPVESPPTRLNARRFDRGRVVISVHGAVNASAADELRNLIADTLRQAGPQLVLIDLAQTHTVDRVGAVALAYGQRLCSSAGARLVLANPPRHAAPLLAAAGMTTQDCSD